MIYAIQTVRGNLPPTFDNSSPREEWRAKTQRIYIDLLRKAKNDIDTAYILDELIKIDNLEDYSEVYSKLYARTTHIQKDTATAAAIRYSNYLHVHAMECRFATEVAPFAWAILDTVVDILGPDKCIRLEVERQYAAQILINRSALLYPPNWE